MSKFPDDVLSDIFTFYGENIFSEPGGHRFWWHTLALVCWKWNDVIRSSPNHFLGDLRLGSDSSVRFLMDISYGGGDSVASLLRRWPLSTLHLHYDLIQPPRSSEDEDNVLVLLQHLERVCSLYLRAPLSTWRSIAAEASDPPISCTSIERINLDTGDRTTGLVLPGTFLAGTSPRLREFTMIGVFPPSLPYLLRSPVYLTSFVLDGIPDSSYLPPDTLLAYLGAMPQLQYLNVGFLSSIPHLRRGGKATAPGPPTSNRVVLSRLGQFYFRGVCAYLEALVTRLDTPRVYDICLTFFHQLSYALPSLSAFLSRTKRFGFDGVRINLYAQGAIISATPVTSRPSGQTFFIRIPCDHLDFQVASVAHVCGALRPNFTKMEDLFIKYHQNQLPVEWSGGVEPALWSEVLAQFHGMKTLWISSALISEVTQAIRSGAQQLLEKMPKLAWTIVEVYRDDASIAADCLSDLLTEIRQSGGPVIDVYRLFSDEWNTRKRPQR
ncbi:hypothetical protein BJV78DRAFT_259328 [Lactifluus subvellereus]|nr:hypothetical protein BJV78DRAFT_259328 [Lactifluus subvellereus]